MCAPFKAWSGLVVVSPLASRCCCSVPTWLTRSLRVRAVWLATVPAGPLTREQLDGRRESWDEGAFDGEEGACGQRVLVGCREGGSVADAEASSRAACPTEWIRER